MIQTDSKVHLTYCTNIHSGESLVTIWSNINKYVLAVRDEVAPSKKFGIGLYLSAKAAYELSKTEVLREFKQFLSENNLYVFTINGFPYGNFHSDRIKEKVYLPDWRSNERLKYTNILADILVTLLSDESGVSGSISTIPCAHKPFISDEKELDIITLNLISSVAHLHALKEKTGKLISIALEPEPSCILETIQDVVDYFTRYIFTESSINKLSTLTGLTFIEARIALHQHLGICLDLCHAAIEFEDPVKIISSLKRVGINIFKIQISSGLRVPNVDKKTINELRLFDEGKYLHQVVEKKQGKIIHYLDLDDAFNTYNKYDQNREWRVHFHVPIFKKKLGILNTTQDFISEFLDLSKTMCLTEHFEVETYTWNVISEKFRKRNIVSDIVGELKWVQKQLGN